MEVILIQDIEGLGYKHDLIKVKNGYGRNYLIAKGFAVLASGSTRKMHEETLRQRAHKEEKMKDEAQSMADVLKKATLKVGAKVGDQGKIFGSVTNLQVAEAIKKLGYEVDRRSITLKEEAIKETGKYQAEIKLHRDIIETVTFEVVEE